MDMGIIIILSIIVLSLTAFFLLFDSYALKTFISEIYTTDNGFVYNGVKAEYEVFYIDFGSAKYIGKTNNWENIFIIGDPNQPDVFYIDGINNTYTYAASDFIIPKSGTPTKIFINPAVHASKTQTVSSNKRDIGYFEKIRKTKGKEKIYYIENFYTDGAVFCYAYNDCAVASVDAEQYYLACCEGKWIYAPLCTEKIDEFDDNSAEVLGIQITDREILDYINTTRLLQFITEERDHLQNSA